MSFVSAGTLRGRIRLGDELRYSYARRAPGSLIQRVEKFPDRSTRLGNGVPVNLIRRSNSALLLA